MAIRPCDAHRYGMSTEIRRVKPDELVDYLKVLPYANGLPDWERSRPRRTAVPRRGRSPTRRPGRAAGGLGR